MCLDYNFDGDKFVTAGNDRLVRLYDDNKMTQVSTMKTDDPSFPGHDNRVFSVCFHQSMPNILASGGWDSSVQFYDIRTSSITGTVYGPHICGDAIDLKDNTLLTGSWSNHSQVQLYDIRNYKLIKTVDWDKDMPNASTYCYSAQFSKDRLNTTYAVGCSNTNMVRMFDSENGDQPVMNSLLLKTCYTVDYSMYGKYFAYGCGDGNVRILDLSRTIK